MEGENESMNTVEIRAKINQRISNLSPEQLNSVWSFLESLEFPGTNNNINQQTVLERMGGKPESLLEGTGNLSDRDIRKKIIANRIQEKHQERHQ
jgi:hypothetical protein